MIACVYADSSNTYHGCVRDSDGTIRQFNAPGAGTGPGQGTQPSVINPAGVITGSYVDTDGVYHGFLRIP